MNDASLSLEIAPVPKKILIIGPAWVGDMIMAQALFKLLKQRCPDTQLDVLAPDWTFPLLERMPEVAQAIELPLKHGELKLRVRYQLAKKLRGHQYDQAIVLPNSFKAALVPWFAKIPKRTGWVGESRYVVLNDARCLNQQTCPLMIDQFLALGLAPNEALPAEKPWPGLIVTKESQERVLAKHAPLWRGRPVLALCAGAEFGPSKRWPEEYFAAVANQKINEGWDVWLFGSMKDRPVTDKIMSLTQHRCENMSGRTVLSETIDLLSLVSAVISNDSGLMHMAAALKKPLIALYGSTSPDFTPPLSNEAHIVKLALDCQPCFQRTCPLRHHRCMRELTPDRVLSLAGRWSH